MIEYCHRHPNPAGASVRTTDPRITLATAMVTINPSLLFGLVQVLSARRRTRTAGRQHLLAPRGPPPDPKDKGHALLWVRGCGRSTPDRCDRSDTDIAT